MGAEGDERLGVGRRSGVEDAHHGRGDGYRRRDVFGTGGFCAKIRLRGRSARRGGLCKGERCHDGRGRCGRAWGHALEFDDAPVLFREPDTGEAVVFHKGSDLVELARIDVHG